MRAFYEDIEEFKEYVDRYAASRGISVDEALTHKMIVIYWAYLSIKDKDVVKGKRIETLGSAKRNKELRHTQGEGRV